MKHMRPPEVGVNFRTATEMECVRTRDALTDVWRPAETGTRSGDLNGPDEDDASYPRFPKTRNVSKNKVPGKNLRCTTVEVYRGIQLNSKDCKVKSKKINFGLLK